MSVHFSGVNPKATSLFRPTRLSSPERFLLNLDLWKSWLVPCLAILSLIACLGRATASETPLTTLRNETREMLRQEAIVDSGPKKDAAIAALCDLYVVLRQDDRYGSSEMLQSDASKIRRRLLTIARRREGHLKRNKIDKPARLSEKVDSAIQSALQDSDSLGALADSGNDPGGHAPGGFPDNGWQLVELIQRIVEPDFWDQNGGPGTIQYFAMRRVLVVRATTDVHEQIRDLLLSLPR